MSGSFSNKEELIQFSTNKTIAEKQDHFQILETVLCFGIVSFFGEGVFSGKRGMFMWE